MIQHISKHQDRARVVAVVGDKFVTIRKDVHGYPTRITFPGKTIEDLRNAQEEAAGHFRWQTGIHIDTADFHKAVTILQDGNVTYHIFVLELSPERYAKADRKRGALTRSLDHLIKSESAGKDLSSTLRVIEALRQNMHRRS